MVDNSASTRTATVTSNNSYFTDALFEDLTQAIMEEYGLDESAARSEILNGGLQVYSTVDPDMQTELETLMLNEDDAIFPAYWTEQEVSSTISADSEITYDENGMPLEPNSDGEMVSVFRDDQTPVYEDDGVTFKTDVDEDSNTLIFYESVRTQASAAVVDYDGQVLALVGGLGEKTNDLVLNRATTPHQTRLLGQAHCRLLPGAGQRPDHLLLAAGGLAALYGGGQKGAQVAVFLYGPLLRRGAEPQRRLA